MKHRHKWGPRRRLMKGLPIIQFCKGNRCPAIKYRRRGKTVVEFL